MSSSEDESDIADYDLEDAPDPAKGSRASQRNAVSAEVYKLDPNFKPPVYEKSDEQKKKIMGVVRKSFLFASLPDPDLAKVIGAFKDVEIKQGETLITQGDEGDCLFLCESGEFEIFVKGKKVAKMGTGQVIGELALMYSCPRMATVVAATDAKLWRLDRETFQQVVKGSALVHRERNMETLERVPLLSKLEEAQRVQLADALAPRKYDVGDLVTKEGEPGDEFFILESGEAEAIKHGQLVMSYKDGDFFGELALLRNQPRAATVRITGEEPAVCLVLHQSAFVRLLGPLENLMPNYDNIPPPA